MSTPSLNVNPARKVWLKNFDKVKSFYEEHGHLTMPNNKEYASLSAWLSYQRHQSRTLRKEQIELLESINYLTTPVHRETDEDKWNAKYNRLKQLHQETGGLRIPFAEHDLATWLSRQKKLLNSGALDTRRKENLLRIGVGSANGHTRKIVKSGFFDAKWNMQYQKLIKYRRVNGDCNVPRGWKQDPSLGLWVHNQRKRYGEMQAGEANMDSGRIQKLEELGFQWTLR